MRTSNTSADDYRHRLLEGMARAVSAKGYADTTIADVVREAAVSRRTFYEHFTTKGDCLIALFRAASGRALKELQAAVDPELEWPSQVERALRAYFGWLAQSPVLLRTLFVEILALGPMGLSVRRTVNEDLAAFMLETVNRGREAGVPSALTPELAMAVVGGINELILREIERQPMGDLMQLVRPATQLVHAVAGNPASNAPAVQGIDDPIATSD